MQDIGKILLAIGREVCTALIGIHALTKSDTVSAFARKDSLHPLEIVKTNKESRDVLIQLGNECLFLKIYFTTWVHGPSTDCTLPEDQSVEVLITFYNIYTRLFTNYVHMALIASSVCVQIEL